MRRETRQWVVPLVVALPLPSVRRRRDCTGRTSQAQRIDVSTSGRFVSRRTLTGTWRLQTMILYAGTFPYTRTARTRASSGR
jgi:hypothetical protein